MTTDNKENNNEIVEERSPPEESVDEKKRSREEDESAEPDEPAVSNTIDISKPVKRARRAYFIFADKVRPEIQAEVSVDLFRNVKLRPWTPHWRLCTRLHARAYRQRSMPIHCLF